MKLNFFVILFGILFFINCSNDDEPSLSSENKIISFKIKPNDVSFTGKINHGTQLVTIETIGLEQNNSIIPEIQISEKATVFPDPSIPQNFNQSVEYIITAENGDKAIYTVKIINRPLSVEKNILSFNFNVGGELFKGKIDENLQHITITTFVDVTNISPEITISDSATISPLPAEKIDFTNEVNYTVTAEDGSTKIYTVQVIKQEIYGTIKNCYIRATSFAVVNFLDISSGKFELVLENELNSYKLNYFDLEFWENDGINYTNFYFTFSEDIVSANNYKLKFKIDGKIKAETPYSIDVLAENAPKITSSNKVSYNYTDTLILRGENLVAGVRIPANGYIYGFQGTDVNLNEEKTELSLQLSRNREMFPSWLGQESPRPTRVMTFFNDRYGDSIILNFE